MRTLWKVLLVVVVVIAVIGAGAVFLPKELPPIALSAEAIPGLTLPLLGPVTNALLGSLVTSLFLITIALLVRSNLRIVPRGLQNLVEYILEFLYNLVESVAGPERAPRFFPLIATIFLFVLLSNLMDVFVPVLSWIGVREVHEGHEVLVPILRSPSTDLNFTLALALIAVVGIQFYGVQALGPSYFLKFFNVVGFIKAFQNKTISSVIGGVLMGFIDFFVGLVELITEVARLLSFSFRLFGNVFAGEVVLLVIPSLVPLVMVLPFMGLELFVGFMQAFIFAVLTLAFVTVATTPHGGEEQH